MFDDLLGNLQKQQEELQQKLAGIFVEAESGDGAVVVKAGADLHIENIRIDPAKLDLTDREQLEDLLVVATNRALELARQEAATESNKLLGSILPGGMDQFLKP
ncbi:MAG TPA: YbaB/EbfC family nucleoid-associated protein [Saprospiraceae bacterium]|nr:YbaB/EbfC family nucleoid-associated protein [Saprospiraceae bacterium]HPI04746.1 YbaB/EbfC family nucleoid-associated protein [Saprospiraceae bacterium]